MPKPSVKDIRVRVPQGSAIAEHLDRAVAPCRDQGKGWNSGPEVTLAIDGFVFRGHVNAWDARPSQFGFVEYGLAVTDEGPRE